MNVMVGQYLLGETGRQLCSGLFVKPVQLQNLERETSKTVLYVASCPGNVRVWHLSLSLYKLTAFVTCSITELNI